MDLLNSELLAGRKSKLRHTGNGENSVVDNGEEMRIWRPLALTERRGFDMGSGEERDINLYQRYILKFNIECWLNQLEGDTFPTEIVALTRKDASILKEQYEEINQGGADKVGKEDKLLDFQEELEVCMSRISQDSDGCFVKTSCRSAKDFANEDTLRTSFAYTLSHLNLNSSTPSENVKMAALSYASMKLLKMTCAAQVVSNFVRSERIWHDMNLALSQSDMWNEGIIVRKWVNIEPDMEFRCFVSSNIVTAISQYRHLVFFPRLLKNEKYLSSMLVEYYYSTIQPKLEKLFPQDDYIVDFAVEVHNSAKKGTCLDNVDLEGQVKKIWTVEVNPFYHTTDACLFSWTKDLAILTNQSPNDLDTSTPIIRIRRTPALGCSSMVYGEWKRIIDEVN